MLLIVKIFGRLIAWTPESILRVVCFLLGAIIYRALPGRRNTALRNLHHCFPEKEESWRVMILKEHCRRLVETALYVMSSPFFSKERAARLVAIPNAETLETMNQAIKKGAMVLMVPHTTLAETSMTMPLRFPELRGRVSVIFRPLNNDKLDHWVRHSRGRFGVQLLSRRAGYGEALKALEANDAVGLLFDQNASGKGSLIHFMGRVVSATELPGIMAHRKQADAYMVCAVRTGFWKAKMEVARLDKGDAPIDLTLSANEWLSDFLKRSDNCCADWLWLHDRWGSPKNPKRRFHLREKRNRLEEDRRFRNGKRPEPVIRVWFFLPKTQEEFRDLADIMEMIRESRPDYALCVIGEHSNAVVSDSFGDLITKTIELGESESRRKTQIEKIAAEYPDVWINLRTDRNSLVESLLSRAEQRFGIESTPRASKYLTHLAPAPTETSWLPFFERFGLGTRKKHRL